MNSRRKTTEENEGEPREKRTRGEKTGTKKSVCPRNRRLTVETGIVRIATGGPETRRNEEGKDEETGPAVDGTATKIGETRENDTDGKTGARKSKRDSRTEKKSGWTGRDNGCPFAWPVCTAKSSSPCLCCVVRNNKCVSVVVCMRSLSTARRGFLSQHVRQRILTGSAGPFGPAKNRDPFPLVHILSFSFVSSDFSITRHRSHSGCLCGAGFKL